MEFKKQHRPKRVTSDTSPRSRSISVPPRPVQQSLSIDQPDIFSMAPPKKEMKKFIQQMIRRKKMAFIIIATVIICLITALLIHNSSGNNPDTAIKAPNYKTALPEGKTISDLGGWKRVSPAKDNPVFAYIDQIDNIPISVSQQPLPQSFKSNAVSQVAELAKKFNATDKIDADGIAVYIGTSSKGPQSVIFTSDDLLILIKSEKQIADTSWAKYIESLKK